MKLFACFLFGAILGSLLIPFVLERFIGVTREPVRSDGDLIVSELMSDVSADA